MLARKWIFPGSYYRIRLTSCEDIVAFILQVALSSVWDVASGSVVLVAMLHPPTLSIILSAPDTRKFNFIHNPPSETRYLNAITVVQRTYFYLVSFLRSQTRLWFSFVASPVLLLRPRRI
jgi:hypothetical protein